MRGNTVRLNVGCKLYMKMLLRKCYGEVITKVLAVGLETVTLQIAKSVGVGCGTLLCS